MVWSVMKRKVNRNNSCKKIKEEGKEGERKEEEKGDNSLVME